MVDDTEDSLHHDDGFDSEATNVTPVSRRNDYYNSLEHIWLKRDQAENFAKPATTRGNSESIGSLSTDASEHDYYNEIHLPVVSDHALLSDTNATALTAV